MKACTKSKSVKRIVLTSSAAAVTINQLEGTGLVLDEKSWTDVEFLRSAKPPTWVISLFNLIFCEKPCGSKKRLP